VAVSGSGDSLGAAITAAITAAAGGGHRRSYTAKGWHAQLSKLTSSERGYQAAADVGLSATARTLREWLSSPGGEHDRAPSAHNQSLIAQAYARMAGVWPAGDIEGKDVRITGEVKIGSDNRHRGGGGRNGSAPFLVDGSAGSWDAIRELWESGEMDPDDIEEAFVDDIVIADLGETTDEWEFPGSSYTVVIG
jgi:hypothetical protein